MTFQGEANANSLLISHVSGRFHHKESYENRQAVVVLRGGFHRWGWRPRMASAVEAAWRWTDSGIPDAGRR
jgi:hypothetical protein